VGYKELETLKEENKIGRQKIEGKRYMEEEERERTR
jgi:hypothetical protein